MPASKEARMSRRILNRPAHHALSNYVAIGVIAAVVSLFLGVLIVMLILLVPLWLHGTSNTLWSSLYAVSCPSVTRCYGSGIAGDLYLSTDGGISWSSQPLLPNHSFAALSCPSTTHCAAATDSNGPGNVVTTSDGGASWTVRSGLTATIQELICPMDLTCLAVTGTAPTSETSLVRSTDGGLAWRTVSLPSLSTADLLSCPAARACLAVTADGTFLTSGDAGASWKIGHASAAPIGATSLACASTLVCAIVADGGLVNTPASSAVWRTTDGGAHWRRVALWSDTTLAALACPSARVCLAVGMIPGGNGRNLVRVTRDGGTTWRVETSPSWQLASGESSIETLIAISCADASTCAVVGNNGVTLATSDAGATWHQGRV
jgi:photosystem II stability/assembly factor-like uncharacterized protein